MKLEKISAIAEIISSIAVLLTLVYLAIQTNQISKQTELNTKAILASTRQETLNQELWMFDKSINDPLFEVARDANSDFNAKYETKFNLSDRDRIRLTSFYNALFRIRENLWFQYTNGVLDKMTWNSYRRVFIDLLKSDNRMKSYWLMISQRVMDKDFVAEINGELNK